MKYLKGDFSVVKNFSFKDDFRILIFYNVCIKYSICCTPEKLRSAILFFKPSCKLAGNIFLERALFVSRKLKRKSYCIFNPRCKYQCIFFLRNTKLRVMFHYRGQVPLHTQKLHTFLEYIEINK